ncbi:MAG: radical SAM protein, partial [Candidatus Aminicenantes bacterium]|nr:radical SAM protein [Candidatus Aminicenantes bacterium]
MNAAWALETGVRLMTAAARGRRIPFQTTLFVTNRCNKKCVYCSIPDDPAPDLSTDAWRTILARLRGAGGRRVLFFGGEPLLRDDIGELVGFARHLGLRAGMTTNGSLVPDRVEAVRNLHSLAVSLDGRPATQERTRGRDSHGEALRAVEIARSCGVPVKLNAVLCADNAAEVPWLLKFSAANRVPLVLNLLRSEETGYHRDAGRHRLEDEAMRELLRTVADAARTHPLMVFSKFTYETARRWPD